MSQPRALTIALDARPLIFTGNGNARYLERMLAELFVLRPDWNWLLFSHKPLHSSYHELLSYPRLRHIISGGRMPGPLWMHLWLKRELKKHRHDLFWGTLAMLPWRYGRREGPPAVVNFHDLNAFVAPGSMVRWNAWQHRLFNRDTLNSAGLVLCLSKATGLDIRRFFPDIPPGRLVVVYPGASFNRSGPEAPPPPVGNLKQFILMVGTLEPRKNQATVVEAYLAARKSANLPPLIIAGKKGWGDDSLYSKLTTGIYSPENIFYLESPTDGQLAWCYKNAAFAVLPSLHEGFGLPVIEAMASGRMALLSDIPVFREIGGESIYVPPLDVDAWARSLTDFSVLARTGRLKPRSFDAEYWSWSRRAEILAQALEKTCH
jgi:glycosyltransferase involved in cell wall biosynthesis